MKRELIEAWVDKEDTEIKEINFRIREHKNEGNTFVYKDYKLTDYLPDNVSIGSFVTTLVDLCCLNNIVWFENEIQ